MSVMVQAGFTTRPSRDSTRRFHHQTKWWRYTQVSPPGQVVTVHAGLTTRPSGDGTRKFHHQAKRWRYTQVSPPGQVTMAGNPTCRSTDALTCGNLTVCDVFYPEHLETKSVLKGCAAVLSCGLNMVVPVVCGFGMRNKSWRVNCCAPWMSLCVGVSV